MEPLDIVQSRQNKPKKVMQTISEVPQQPRMQDAGPLPSTQLLCCPRCLGKLLDERVLFRCSDCGETYPFSNGIPQLFVPNQPIEGKLDVTDIVKEFYEEIPFPNYDDL